MVSSLLIIIDNWSKCIISFEDVFKIKRFNDNDEWNISRIYIRK